MSKRRRGYPSETQVRRGERFVHGDKLLVEKLGRADLCPCGSGLKFPTLLSAGRETRWLAEERLLPRLKNPERERLTMNITAIVKDKNVYFVHYREGHFFYETDDGFHFSVPIEDVGKATLPAREKAIYFMRWIRRQLQQVKQAAGHDGTAWTV